MVLDMESGWALVPGSMQPKEKFKMKVKAVLGFWNAGELVKPGTEIEVDDSVGREVITSGKAILADPPKDRPAKGAGSAADPFEEMSNDDLRTYLDKKKVEYPSHANKAELVELAKAAA
jgi:Putative nuclear envelope organisation protein